MNDDLLQIASVGEWRRLITCDNIDRDLLMTMTYWRPRLLVMANFTVLLNSSSFIAKFSYDRRDSKLADVEGSTGRM